MKAGFTQRFVAYMIDVIIVSVLFAIVSLVIPTNSSEIKDLNEEYTKAESRLVEIMSSDNKENYQEIMDEVYDIQYQLSRKSIFRDSVLFVITFAYFVILQFALKGKTIGKMAMRIKVVDKKKKEPSLGVILIRTLIINGLLTSFISIISILFLAKKVYTLFNGTINLLGTLFIVVSAIMVLYRKDKRGLHDMMAGSSVVIDKK